MRERERRLERGEGDHERERRGNDCEGVREGVRRWLGHEREKREKRRKIGFGCEGVSEDEGVLKIKFSWCFFFFLINFLGLCSCCSCSRHT